MLSSNNHSEQIKKQMPKQQRFAIKKLTVGVASVLVGLSFMGITQDVHADVAGSAQQTSTEKQATANNDNDGNQATLKASAAASQVSGADQTQSVAQSGASSSAASSVASSAASQSVASDAVSSAASNAQNSSAANPFVVLASSDANSDASQNDKLANYAGVHFVFEDANGNLIDGQSITGGSNFNDDTQEGFYDKSNLYVGHDLATQYLDKTWDVVNNDFITYGYKLVNWKDVVAQMVPGSTPDTAAFKMGTTVVLKYAKFANVIVQDVDADAGKVLHQYTLYTNGSKDASLTYLYNHDEANGLNWGYSKLQPYSTYVDNYTFAGTKSMIDLYLDDNFPVQTVNADGTVNPNDKVVQFMQRNLDDYKATFNYVNALTGKPLNVKKALSYWGYANYMPNDSSLTFQLTGSSITNVFNEFINLPGYKLVNWKDVVKQLTFNGDGFAPSAKLPANITLKYAPLSNIYVNYRDASTHKIIFSGMYSTQDLTDTSIQYRMGDKTSAAAPRYVINPVQLNGYKLVAGEGPVTGYIDDDFPTQTLNADGTYKDNPKVIEFNYEPTDNTDSGVDAQGHAYGQSHQMWTEYRYLAKPTVDGKTRLPGSFVISGALHKTFAQNGFDFEGKFQKQVDLIKPMGWNYTGSTGAYNNNDYYNDITKTWNYFTPNQPVFVNYYDTKGNKLTDTVTLASNKNNPDQSNDGINGMYLPYGNWTAPQRDFNGYTLVKTEGATSGQFNSFTYTVNFIYAADTTGKVSYIDDTDNTTLRTDDLSGVTGQAIDYTTADKVKELEGKGLTLVSNNFKDGHETYNENAAQNVFEIHFKHATENKDQQQQIKETIHYVYADGSQAAPDAVRTVNFKRTNTIDQHNGKVTNGNWTPDTQSFAAVVSPTIANYTANKTSIDAQTVKAGDSNLEFTVIYNRDTTKGQVKYIDDTTGAQLDADSLNGNVGDAIDYTTAGKVKNFEDQGLELVHNDFKDGHETYNKDANKNDFEVHFKHATTQSTENKVVKETIHYVYEDGTTASPDFEGSITFTRNNTYDKYTKQTTNGDWFSDTGTFDTIVSPTIKGYKPSIASVAGYTVTPNSEDKTVTVIYSQQATKGEVSYVDLTANRVLATVPLNGNIGDPIDYTTAGKIADYEKQGLVLFHNDFKDGQENFAKNENQNFFEVQFKHAFKDSQENSTVKEIIHYVYDDGSKAADDYTAHIDFSRTKHTDLYTGDTNFTRYTPWTPEVGQFKAVDSPVIANFTPNMLTVPAMGEYAGNPDYEMTVVYTRNAAQGMVTYYDDTTGIQLRQDSLNGKAGQAIDYTTADKVAQFKAISIQRLQRWSRRL